MVMPFYENFGNKEPDKARVNELGRRYHAISSRKSTTKPSKEQNEIVLEIVDRFYPLFVKMANNFINNGCTYVAGRTFGISGCNSSAANLNVEELIQEGITGLVAAFHKYVPDRSKVETVSSFVGINAAAAMSNYIIKNVPNHNQIKTYNRKRKRYGGEDGKAPHLKFVSLNDAIGEDRELGDVVIGLEQDDPEEVLNSRLNQDPLRRKMEAVLDQLDKRDRYVLVSRNYLEDGEKPKTLEELGAELGISRERVRQLEVRAMSNFRNIIESVYPDFSDFKEKAILTS